MFLKRLVLLLFIVGALLPGRMFAQSAKKAAAIANMMKAIDALHANVGVAIVGLDFKDSLFINPDKHFPMQSVYKFPLAMAVLNKVDNGSLPLNMNLHIPQGRIDTNTWSPMAKDFPNKDVNITLKDLLAYAISKSDNNACDILFSLVGGTKVANRYVDSIGVKGINIVATEAEMKTGWDVQYTNWSEPKAMLQLLRVFYNGKVLQKESNDLLMQLMTESVNSDKRIKGLLPTGTVVAHKTGTSNTNDQGLTAGTNDIGIVTLPDGRHFAIVVFVSDYKGGVDRGEKLIAEIAKLAWDYFSK